MRFLSCAILLVLWCVLPLAANDNVAIPIDHFSGIKLDEPVVGPFYTYKPIHVSGTVADPWVSEIRLTLRYNEDENVANCGGFNSYTVLVQNGKFKHTFFFSHEQADEYLMLLRTKRDAAGFSPAGVFRPISIQRNAETSPIPPGFFPNIELVSPIPVEITTGQAVRVAGTVFDPSLTMVALSFYQKEVNYRMTNRAPVIDGQFKKTLFFANKTAGEYTLSLYRYRGNSQSSSLQDVFRPIDIKDGERTAFLPSDYFEEIELTSPMPVVYAAGRSVRVTGNVPDPSVHRIDFEFWMPTAVKTRKAPVRFSAQVTNGEFSAIINFKSKQRPGDGFLHVYLWRRGKHSKGPREFKPITLMPPPSPDFNRDGTIGFADFVVFAEAFGRTIDDGTFDSRFDLNGDGTVDFGDFLIFANAFGQ